MKIYHLGLVALSLFIFQNCGSFKAYENENFYTYTSKPDYFYDLKLVSVDVDEVGRQTYTFDLAVSYAEDSEQGLDFYLAFSTLARSSSCPTLELRAEEQSKHQRFVCKIPVADTIFVQLTMMGPSEVPEATQFQFE